MYLNSITSRILSAECNAAPPSNNMISVSDGMATELCVEAIERDGTRSDHLRNDIDIDIDTDDR